MKTEPIASRGKLAIISWCLYDFANSPFTTLVVTFIFSPFFAMSIVGDRIAGTELWSRAITVSALIIAILSPILGAVADRGYRKMFLFLTTALAVWGSAMLYWVLPARLGEGGEIVAAGDVGKALIWFVIANVAYELGCVFYNAFLPDVAPEGKIGRVSGYGWATGYAGGLLALTVALVCLVYPQQPWFGFTREMQQHIRATNLLAAVWFAVFSIPIFLWVHEKRSPQQVSYSQLIGSSVRQLSSTFHEIRKYKQIVRFLIAHLFYNDGLITIFAFSGLYATGTFGFTTSEMLVLAIGLNIAAGAGAFAMGFLDDYVGGKKTIQISLYGLLLAAILAIFAPGKTWLWIAGILAGIFSGPNQSASRSLMGRFVPAQKENEFFGFLSFSGKATSFLGPLFFGLLTRWWDSQRAGISIVVVLFLLGILILHTVDEDEGIRTAGNRESESRDQ